MSKGTVGSGFKAELFGQVTRDGKSTFNVENLLGTAAHFCAGLFGAWAIRKMVAPNFKTVQERIGG